LHIYGYKPQAPENRENLALNVSKERNVFVAERFLSDIVRDYGK
jgi:putative transposase